MDEGLPMSLTHEELSADNLTVASKAPTNEWSITMLFYAAVHAADHVLFGSSGAPDTGYDHKQREERMWQDKTLRTLRQQYLELKNLSIRSRYVPAVHPMTPLQLQHAERLAKHILKKTGVQVVVPSPSIS